MVDAGYTPQQRERVFYSFAFYHFINDAIVFLIPSLMATFYDMFGLSFFQTSIIFATNTGMIVIMQMINGHLSDRNKEKPLFLIGLCTLVLSTFLLIYSFNFISLWLFTLFNGFGLGFIHAINYVTITKMYPDNREVKIGEMGGWGDAGKLIGIVSAALILSSGTNNWQLPLQLWAGTGVILLFFSAFTITRFPFHQLHAVEDKTADKSIFRYSSNEKNGNHVRSKSLLILFFMLSFMYSGHFDPMTKPIVLYLHVGRIGLSNTYAPVIYTVMMAFGALGSFVSGRMKRKLGFRNILTLCYSILIIFTIIFTFANIDNLGVDLFLLSIIGFFTLPIYTSFYSELSYYMNPNRMGISYGLLMGIGWSGGFVSSLIAGYLADLYGYQMYMITGLVFLCIALVLTFIISHLIHPKNISGTSDSKA
jgi:MFS family permease